MLTLARSDCCPRVKFNLSADRRLEEDNSQELANDVARRRVLAHVELGGAILRIEDAVASLHGTPDFLRALPHNLGEVRGLRVLGVVLGCTNSSATGKQLQAHAIRTNFIRPGLDGGGDAVITCPCSEVL